MNDYTAQKTKGKQKDCFSRGVRTVIERSYMEFVSLKLHILIVELQHFRQQ